MTDLDKNTNCIELAYFDIVDPFIETAEKLAKDREDSKIFHVPALFGDDFAYSEASYNYDFLKKL